jgi:hypothetical protein
VDGTAPRAENWAHRATADSDSDSCAAARGRALQRRYLLAAAGAQRSSRAKNAASGAAADARGHCPAEPGV